MGEFPDISNARAETMDVHSPSSKCSSRYVRHLIGGYVVGEKTQAPSDPFRAGNLSGIWVVIF
jgi:hypothetical protein